MINRSENVILVDCDGVAADFVGALVGEINRRTGSRFSPKDVTGWEVAEALGVDQSLVSSIIEQRGFISGIAPTKGAAEGIDALRMLGEVYIVTTPWWTSPTFVYERTWWLKKHFGIEPERIVFTEAKHLVTGMTLVDDKPENVLGWTAKQGKGAYLWDAPWNRDAAIEGSLRVKSWTQIAQDIERRLNVHASLSLAAMRRWQAS